MFSLDNFVHLFYNEVSIQQFSRVIVGIEFFDPLRSAFIVLPLNNSGFHAERQSRLNPLRLCRNSQGGGCNRGFRCTCAILVAAAGLSASQKCRFSALLPYFRLSFLRKSANFAHLLHFVHFISEFDFLLLTFTFQL